jgi:predicted RNA binding protein YcfA (HicA-like mRNA interferase family)
VKSNKLIRFLQKDGWFVIRQSGGQMIMQHPTKKGQIVCPNYGCQEMP